MRSDRVHIDSPCHESWDAMEGDAARRFCGVCSKHVHNLSAMNVDDAHELLRASAGQELCVRYSAEADGSMRFRDLVPRSRLTRGLVRTAFAASILAACMPQDRAPVIDVGQAAIASLIEPPLATGGCDLSPTPAVTFHLPPGHFLCALTGDDAAATDLPPAALLAAPPPAIAPPPAHVPPPAYVPPPRIASAPPPLVASAPPHPEHYQPYAPGFAPPPPPARVYDRLPPRGGFAPPPPAPQPFPGHGFAPPPPPPDPFPLNDPTPVVTPPRPLPRPEPLMGSISVPDPEPLMGRRSPTR